MIENLRNNKEFLTFSINNCFNAALNTIIQSYGFRPDFLMMNEIINWEYDEHMTITQQRDWIIPVRSIMSKMHFIYQEEFYKNKDILDEIINGIDSGYVYAVFLQSPISRHPNTKNILCNHGLIHWIVIYGYDEVNKFFRIFDFMDPKNFIYSPMIMLFSDFIESYDNTQVKVDPYYAKVCFEEEYRCDMNTPYLEFYAQKKTAIKSNMIDSFSFIQSMVNNLIASINSTGMTRGDFLHAIKNLVISINYLKKIEYIFKYNCTLKNHLNDISGLIGNMEKLKIINAKLFEGKKVYTSEALRISEPINRIFDHLIRYI